MASDKYANNELAIKNDTYYLTSHEKHPEVRLSKFVFPQFVNTISGKTGSNNSRALDIAVSNQ